MSETTTPDIAALVRDVVVKVLGPLRHPSSDEESLTDLGADAVDRWSIAMEIEERLHLPLDDDDLIQVDTIADLIRFTQDKMEARHG